MKFLSRLKPATASPFLHMGSEEFVDFCYQRILKRDADSTGRSIYIDKLNKGLNRLEMLQEFLCCEENINLKARHCHTEFNTPGHFYSPLPDVETVERQYEEMALQPVEDGLIDFRLDAQKALLKKLSVYYKDLPFSDKSTPPIRYSYINNQFGHADAITLFSMIREFKPKRVIEVGSGHSSAVMLDTNQHFFAGQIDLTFIEPYPDRLHSLLTDEDYHHSTILEQPVQAIPLQRFEALQENDILFIDCSHVMKFGSDFGHLLFSVVPQLNKGVIIHFHDIFWPFEYPKPWLMEGRAWNEAYVLRAFLSYNRHFEILYFNDYMIHKARDLIEQYQPEALRNTGCSLWLRKQ